MPSVSVRFLLGKKEITAPLRVNAKSEAGIGFICGVYLHFLPWGVAQKVTIEVDPLQSANQLLYGIRLGYADKSIPHSLYGQMDLQPQALVSHLEDLVAQREAYMHFHAPASHVASNYASNKFNMSQQALALAKLLASSISSGQFQLNQLQSRANELASKHYDFSRLDPGQRALAEKEQFNERQELNDTLNQLARIKQNPGEPIPVRLPKLFGSGLLSEYETLGDLADYYQVPEGTPLQTLQAVGGAAQTEPSLAIKEQVANALAAIASQAAKSSKIKHTLPLAKMRGKPKRKFLKSGLQMNIGKALVHKHSYKYPLLPPRYLNVGKRAATIPSLLKPPTDIRGFLEQAFYGNSPIMQRAYLQEQVRELEALSPDLVAFERRLKEISSRLNPGGVSELMSLLRPGARGAIETIKRQAEAKKKLEEAREAEREEQKRPQPMEPENAPLHEIIQRLEVAREAEAARHPREMDIEHEPIDVRARRIAEEARQREDAAQRQHGQMDAEYEPLDARARRLQAEQREREVAEERLLNGPGEMEAHGPSREELVAIREYQKHQKLLKRQEEAAEKQRNKQLARDEDRRQNRFGLVQSEAVIHHGRSLSGKSNPAPVRAMAQDQVSVAPAIADLPPPEMDMHPALPQAPEVFYDANSSPHMIVAPPPQIHEARPSRQIKEDISMHAERATSPKRHRSPSPLDPELDALEANSSKVRMFPLSAVQTLQRIGRERKGKGLRKLLAAKLIDYAGMRIPVKQMKLNRNDMARYIKRTAMARGWHPQYMHALLQPLEHFKDE